MLINSGRGLILPRDTFDIASLMLGDLQVNAVERLRRTLEAIIMILLKFHLILHGLFTFVYYHSTFSQTV